MCSLKHHKLNVLNKCKASLPHCLIFFFTIYIKKMGFHKNCWYLKSDLHQWSPLTVAVTVPLRLQIQADYPGYVKEPQTTEVLRERNVSVKIICIEVQSKQHLRHFNSLHSCCYSHPQGQRLHKGSPGIWNGSCLVI